MLRVSEMGAYLFVFYVERFFKWGGGGGRTRFTLTPFKCHHLQKCSPIETCSKTEKTCINCTCRLLLIALKAGICML